jgi:hypothetical protein
MAPGLLEKQPTAPHTFASKNVVDHSIFPDGIKTSGQHPPLYDELKPYSAFPKEITGPTVWKAEDYENQPEKWVHVFTEEEIAELSAASDKYLADGTPLTAISKVCLLSFEIWNMANKIRTITHYQISQSYYRR